MRKRRHTEAQIVAILKELDAGRPVAELARKHGVHVNTLRLWRRKYGGLNVSDLSRLKELESENSQIGTHHRTPGARNPSDVRGDSKKRVGCPRPTVRYKSCKAPDDELVRDRLRCVAQECPRFGRRRLKILIKRQGIEMNHKTPAPSVRR